MAYDIKIATYESYKWKCAQREVYSEKISYLQDVFKKLKIKIIKLYIFIELQV